MAKQNCYTILRQFYMDNYGIELTDYACPTNWWAADLDLYGKLSGVEGFSPIHLNSRDWLPGDVIIMAIQSVTGNHAAIVLENGEILHHLVGQRSCVTAYGGMFRNATVAVYRHKDVPQQRQTVNLLDFREALPPHVRRRFEQLQRTRSEPDDDAGARPDA
jgi:cell wall-associated NlpC family hydrolase